MILKKKDIALLKLMGFTQKNIAFVFITLGMILTLIACIIGISTAIIVGFCLEKYKWISLPDIYDTTHLPVMITIPSILFVIGLIIILGSIATLLGVYHIRNINISHTLRFEE